MVLPEESVGLDDAWNHAIEWDAMHYGQLAFKSHYTYVGSGERAGTHKLQLKADETISMSSREDQKMQGKVSGEYLFKIETAASKTRR